MKVVHSNSKAESSRARPALKMVHNSRRPRLVKEPDEDWRDLALAFERSGSVPEAIECYENDLKANPLHSDSCDRLLILLRRLKDFDKEWKVLESAIDKFEKFYSSSAKRSHGSRVQALSKALMKSTGLTDKKGKPLYVPEPLGKWYRRRGILKKKLGL